MSVVFAKAYRFVLVLILIGAGVVVERLGVVAYLSDPFEFAYTLRLAGQNEIAIARTPRNFPRLRILHHRHVDLL